MTRILARHIIYDGTDRGLAVAEFSDDRSSVQIAPFTAEIHSTVWVDGTVVIYADQKGRYQWRKM